MTPDSEAKDSELLPCPMCGEADIADDILLDGNRFVGCTNCSTISDYFDWNKRTPSASRMSEWLPISTAPSNELIYIMHAGYCWVGTGKYYPGEDWEEEPHPHCSVLHYNGDVLVPVFYATHWQSMPETMVLAANALPSKSGEV